MAARAGEERFFADESVLGVGKALTIARRDTIHTGHPLIPEVPLGAKDPEWIPLVADRGLVALGRDGKMRTRPGEKELIIEHKLRVIRIGDKRDLNGWDMLVRFVRYWGAIEEEIARRGEGPWFLLLMPDGLHEWQLRP